MSTKTLHITDESQSVTKTIVLLAWPVFLEQIFTTLVSYADTAMVGSLGAWATASVTISNPPIMLLNGIVMALGVGITSLVARGVGAKDPQTVKKLMHHAIWAIIVIGIPICLITTALHRMIPLWMESQRRGLRYSVRLWEQNMNSVPGNLRFCLRKISAKRAMPILWQSG